MVDQELEAAVRAVREAVNATGYGSYVSDDYVRQFAKAALDAAKEVRDSL